MDFGYTMRRAIDSRHYSLKHSLLTIDRETYEVKGDRVFLGGGATEVAWGRMMPDFIYNLVMRLGR